MATLSVILNDIESHFHCLKHFEIRNLGKYSTYNSMFTHASETVHGL